MDYRSFLIYLSAIGVINNQIIEIEDFIKKSNISYEELLFNFSKYEKNFKKSTINKLLNYRSDLLDRLYNHCNKNSIDIVTYLDEDYPKNLLSIIDFPRVIYIKGKLIEEDKYSIGIVGSRKHTEYGDVVVNNIVDYLSDYNITIVSGMAYGVDAISHKRALKNKMRTIAVLGCGVDVIYPKANENLYNEIENYGAILSEYPPLTPPNAFRFPERNRIISGLSIGIIVVEAMLKSGSLITARIGAEQGREVFAVPGPINSLYSQGTNKLIKDGAILLSEGKDIIDTFPNIPKVINNISSDMDLTDQEQKVLNEIRNGVNDINIISKNLSEDISYINSIVTILELKELLTSKGSKVSLNKN